ncbi:hypothetical protein AAVH_13663 [Aphelenchoides avenae]|nr:hypothetical protein AAVH_33132 [Aphelenchus avenae]KAH7718893.1 hypothetical protein AAVH_13663 [Aphelenchus avenae]
MHNKLSAKDGSYKWKLLSKEEKKIYDKLAKFTEELRKKWYKALSPPVKRVLMKSRKVKSVGKLRRAELLQISDELQEALKEGPESDRVTWRKILENARVDQEHPSDREVSGNEFDEDDIGKDESSGNDEHDKDDELK